MSKKNKIKILFISPLPPPFYGSAMSSQFCLDILNDVDTCNVYNIKTNYSKDFDDIGSISFKKIMGFFVVLWKTFFYSVKIRPQIVYIMPATSGFGFIRDFSVSILARLINTNILYHLRTQITYSQGTGRLKRSILKFAFRKSRVIILGKELITEIDSYFNANNIYILPNAIEGKLTNNEYDSIINEKKIKPIKLTFISNMMRTKGWPLVLESAKRLKELDFPFLLNFAGAWPSKIEETDFFNFLTKNEITQNVKYLGYLNENEKHFLLRNTDILLFPTEKEAFGRVIIEAMEFGIPVIANSIGSIPSIIIHDKNGFLLNNKNPEEMVNYIIRFTDIKIYKEFSKNARHHFLENFEAKVFRKAFMEIIYQLR